MADAIGSCVHCGFCLPTCPTYVTLGREKDSPRGRIFLMKEVLEGSLGLEAALDPVDNCLGCQACVTAYPSGVEYGELLAGFRAYAEARRGATGAGTAQRALVHRTLPYPRRFRAAARAGRATRRAHPEAAAADGRSAARRLPRRNRCPNASPPRASAAGGWRCWPAACSRCWRRRSAGRRCACWPPMASRRWFRLARAAAARSMHTGGARRRAGWRGQPGRVPGDVDAMITNAAGCGSGMHEYPAVCGRAMRTRRRIRRRARTSAFF